MLAGEQSQGWRTNYVLRASTDLVPSILNTEFILSNVYRKYLLLHSQLSTVTRSELSGITKGRKIRSFCFNH